MSNLTFTKSMRETLAQKLATAMLAERTENFAELTEETALKGLRFFLTEEEEEVLNRPLVAKFTSKNSTLNLNVPGLGYVRVPCKSKLLPQGNWNWLDTNNLEKEAETAFIELITAFQNEKDDLEQEERRLVVEFNATLKAFKTVKALRTAMPEVEPLLEGIVPPEGTTTGTALVPYEAIEKTREMIKGVVAKMTPVEAEV